MKFHGLYPILNISSVIYPHDWNMITLYACLFVFFKTGLTPKSVLSLKLKVVLAIPTCIYKGKREQIPKVPIGSARPDQWTDGGLFFNHIDIVFSASLFHLLNGLVDGPNKGLFLPLTIMTTLSLTVYIFGQ